MSDYFSIWLESLITWIGSGIIIGFISWAIGFAIYGIIKMFKMA